MTAMIFPRWVWWVLGIVTAIVSAPFLILFCFGILMFIDGRPRAFEEKVQLKRAAVWTSGTTQTPATSGDACSIKYTLQFARTGEDREDVDEIEETHSESCFTEETLSRAAWFSFGNGTYLRIRNDLYSSDSQGRWHKHPSPDVENDWVLSYIKTKEGQIIYKRSVKGRTSYRVFQLPQQVGAPWILKGRPLSG